MVEGTFTNVTGNETGITVNGIMALVYEGRFVANHVPLVEGENTITVAAVDIDGYTATAEFTVYAQIPANYIRIKADTESGVALFETGLKVEGTFDFPEEPTITGSGPVPLDYLEGLGDDQYLAGMSTPGIYYFTAEATDGESSIYTDTIALVVLDPDAMDAMLRAKWNGMKAALMVSDVQTALSFFHETSKQDYQEIFNSLADKLPAIASGMREIESIYFQDKVAKYRIKRQETVQGQTYDITYYIYFVKDANGL